MGLVEDGVSGMFKVDVSHLKDNPGQVMSLFLEGVVSGEKQDGEDIVLTGPVKADLELTGTAEAILAKGTVAATVQLNCSRCLEPFRLELKAPFEEIYYHTGKGEEDWIFFAGPVIDLEPEIIKAILLEIPMKALCRENCRGLCPQCGKNLNASLCGCGRENPDPRLAALKDFFHRK